jgi:hypothetical protein
MFNPFLAAIILLAVIKIAIDMALSNPEQLHLAIWFIFLGSILAARMLFFTF